MSMQTYSRFIALSFFALAVAWPSGRIGALEGAGTHAAAAVTDPSVTFGTPRAALHAGLESVRSGDSTTAIEALKYAAARGEPLARWRLAKIYAMGEGVPHDDVKAYDYFWEIVTSYDEESPNRRDQQIVSSAFVAVGLYSLNGIENVLKPDPARALQMFRHAATNFRDANAQYHLARMYLDGLGIEKDSRQAVRWLYLAADKGHPQAQARLGQMLFAGQESVKPQRALGLMWLTLARDSAKASEKDQWIIDLYNRAMAKANDEDREVALAYVEGHQKRRN
jgi:TPR repeat protein